MVFQLTDGNMADRHKIEQEYTIEEAIEWLQLHTYENYVMKKMTEK